MNVNWSAIKAEYIAGGISQRKLAKKYGISFGTLAQKANKEKWAEHRETVYNKTITKAEQKTAEFASDNAVTAQRIRKKLLALIEEKIDQHPDDIGGKIRFRELTGAWKDLTEDLVIAEDSQSADESGFTEALNGVALEVWNDEEE